MDDPISFTGRFDGGAKLIREIVKEHPEIVAPIAQPVQQVVSGAGDWGKDVLDFFLTLFGFKEPD